ncbi:Extracellular calcium-sensing receptor [Varanus komodoensis]|nr:Extracellular calcium-sensing receptor [Varanus komodoensis]
MMSPKSYCSMIPKNYQHLLAFVFAIHEINKDAALLRNMTLGSKIYKNAFNQMQACWSTLDLLFMGQGDPTNYNCVGKDTLMAVVGGVTSQTSIQIARVLNIYKIAQLSYGAFDPVLRDKTRFPSFYRMVPNEDPQSAGIVKLLKHFNWNWVGFIVSDDDSGETFLRTLRPRLLQNAICLAWVRVVPIVTGFMPVETLEQILRPIEKTLLLSKINVILVYGDHQSLEGLKIVLYYNEIDFNSPIQRVWITTAEWDYSAISAGYKFTAQSFNGTLSFNLHTTAVPGFLDFVKSINPYHSTVHLIQHYWVSAFRCSLPQYNLYMPRKKNCTGEEKLESLPGSIFEMEMSGQSYSSYNAVYAVAHALQAMELAKVKQTLRGDGDKWDFQKVQPWLLHSFLRCIHFNNSAGEKVYFDDNRDLAWGYDLINLVTFPNGSFQRVQVGRLKPKTLPENEFIINASAIVWNPKFNQVEMTIVIDIIT